MNHRKLIGVVAAVALLIMVVAVPFAVAAGSGKSGKSGGEKNIVQTAKSAGFTTLVKAVKVAGLTKALSGDGPFTVFAPTNKAFAALPKGTLDSLLKDPKALAKVLKFHVVAGEVYAKDITNGMKAKTLEGSSLKFTIKDGKVFVNGARVTTADVKASNGVIHVINKVLVPKN